MKYLLLLFFCCTLFLSSAVKVANGQEAWDGLAPVCKTYTGAANGYMFTVSNETLTAPKKLFWTSTFSSSVHLDCFSYILTPSSNDTSCTTAVDALQFYAQTSKATSLFQGTAPYVDLTVEFGHLIGGGVMSVSVYNNHFFNTDFYLGLGSGATDFDGSLLPNNCGVTVQYSYTLYSSLTSPANRLSFVPYWKNMTPHVLITNTSLTFELTRPEVALPVVNGVEQKDALVLVPSSIHWCDAVTNDDVDEAIYNVTYTDITESNDGLWNFQMNLEQGLDVGYWWLCIRPAGWTTWHDVGYLDVHGNNPAYFLLPMSTVTSGNNVASGTLHVFDFYGIGLDLRPGGDQAKLVNAAFYSCTSSAPAWVSGTDLGPTDLYGQHVEVARWEADLPSGSISVRVCYKRAGDFEWTQVHFLDQVPPDTAAHIQDLDHLRSESGSLGGDESLHAAISSEEQAALDSTRIDTVSSLSFSDGHLANIDPTPLSSLSSRSSDSSDISGGVSPTPAPTPEPSTAPPTPAPTPEPSTAPPTPAPTPEPSTAPPTPAPTPEPSTAPPTPAPTPEPSTAPPTPAPTPEPSTLCTSGTAPKEFTDTNVEIFNYASLVMSEASVPSDFVAKISVLLCVPLTAVQFPDDGSVGVTRRQKAAVRRQEAILINGSYVLHVRIQCSPTSTCAGQSKAKMLYLAYILGSSAAASEADKIALGVQGTESSSAHDTLDASSDSDTAKQTAIMAGIIVGAILIIIIAVVLAIIIVRKKKDQRSYAQHQDFYREGGDFDGVNSPPRAAHNDHEFDTIRQGGHHTFEVDPDEASSPDHMIPKPGLMIQEDERGEFTGTVLELDDVEIVGDDAIDGKLEPVAIHDGKSAAPLPMESKESPELPVEKSV